ncbi:MAG TPA: DUF6766 family protein [Gemmatimonadaceae bacterium]|nr:DUF6766 family protein [Gemmatimonadaceae bacterium]
MRRFLRENGLSLTMLGLFAITIVGQAAAGIREYNQSQLEHGEPTVALLQYLASGHFIEAVFENWESEFLQMTAFVVLSAMLYQKGSPESKSLDEPEPVDADPRLSRKRPGAPWPVRRGGLVLQLYERSLGIALFLLFAISFALHAVGGAREYSAEQLAHGGEAVSTLAYLTTSRFWFESLQNWQSEFLSVGALVLLTIFLRQRGSPQSKPVAAPHGETGEGGEEESRPEPPRRRRRGAGRPAAA